MSIESLNEDQLSELDALDGDAPGFDFETVYRDLGESEPERADAIASAAKAWKEILRFCLRGKLEDPRYLRATGLRVVALAWVISPELFPGSPSQAEMARRLGCSPANIAPHTAEFSRLFRVRNRAQCHYNGNHSKESKDEQPSQN